MSTIRKHHEIDAATRLIADWRSMAITHAIYEHGSLRYSEIASLLDFSPTILSQKLAQLTEHGIIARRQALGAKEVIYSAEPIAKTMVAAYHLLESVNDSLIERKNN